MNDVEFESLRLAFGRPAKKKFKSATTREPAGDPSDVNGYLGPWAPKIAAESEVPSGPSEVNARVSLEKIVNFCLGREACT